MELKKFAEKLSGREYRYPQFTAEEIKEAKDNNIVIIYGASDDLMEADGAIYDEGGCFDGGTIRFYHNKTNNRWGMIEDDDDNNDSVFSITAKWCEDIDENGNIISWTYETSLEHETFIIMEDGEIYCKGIVFKLPI